MSLSVFSGLAIGQNETLTEKVNQSTTIELKKYETEGDIPVLNFLKPNVSDLLAEDLENDKNGVMYRFGVGMEVDITPQNSGKWSTNQKGDRVWKLKIHQPDAKALSFIFSEFDLKGDAFINVYDENGIKVHKTYTKEDVLESGQQNLSLCRGDLLTIKLVEPAGTPASTLRMEKLFYAYRSYGDLGYNTKVGESDPCQVNVNCPEGDNWQDEKKGVARILITQGFTQGLCTGSLINNANEDCKPYFLTAMHCVEDVSASDLNNTRFYFNYEGPGCSDPSQSQVPSQYITGGQRLAGSDDVNGNTIAKSDFFLIRLGTPSTEASIISELKSYGAYWNGWNANNTASSGGVGIHHPSGDVKKISTYTQTLQSASYSNINPNTHWVTYWSSTSSGHGVTEGGSSGSPLFTYNGGNSHIVGTLSGGSSYCNATSSPDLYGKMSYHWTSAGNNNNSQLKPWLDPGNTGIKVLDGSADPCDGGTNPDPDPDPSTCEPDPGECDEYISNVSLEGINNTTGCDNYTDYSNLSATLTAGGAYQMGVTPGVVGEQGAVYYPGDVIGVWVDWNENGTFSDANEEVVIEALNDNSPATHGLTVPSNVSAGTYVMRVRIDYDSNGEGNISPCDDSQYGEVEDYRIIVEEGGNPNPGQDDYDIEVVMNSPASASTVQPSTDQPVSFTVKNNGPGDVAQGDTLWFAYVHLNNATQEETLYSIATGDVNSVNGVIISSGLPSGQSINSADLGADLSNASINTSVYQNTDKVFIWCLGAANSANDLLPDDPNDANNNNNRDYFVIDDGGGSTSGIDDLSMNAIGLYPNPTTGQVTLDLNSNHKNVEVVIYDLTGKVVTEKRQSNAESIALDFSKFDAGVYQVAVKTEQGKVIRKVIKK